jgi:hypothetical protein
MMANNNPQQIMYYAPQQFQQMPQEGFKNPQN